ncbi:MAG: flagellar motor switch protein FliM [bacterium]
MAQDTLSQSEIDALLSQTQQVDEETEEERTPVAKEKAVFSFNFRKQKKFNKSQFVLLESIHKRFLRNFEVTMTNLLNRPIIASLAAASELTFGDCLDSFSSPTCIYVLNLEGAKGKFILEIDPNFAFFVIDKILGGSGKDSTVMERELSLIEERIMHRVVSLLRKDLADAWERVHAMNFAIEGFYAQPDYVQVIGNTETVILVSMDVRGGDKVLGYLNLCLLSSSLEILLNKYDKTSDTLSRSPEQYHKDRQDIGYQVMKSVLPVKVVLGRTSMKIADLLNLENGDVIYLPSEMSRPVDVVVGNLSLFKALPVKKENTMAIQIEEIISQKSVL